MSPRTALRVARSIRAMAVVLGLVGVVLALVASSYVFPAGARDPLATVLLVAPIAFVWVEVGALVGSRRPGNQIAWFYCAIGLGLALLGFTTAYAAFALYGPDGRVAGGPLAAWASQVLFVPCVFIGPVSMFFVFPDGCFLSRRWRVAGLVFVPLGLLCGGVAVAVQPGPLDGFVGVVNPVGVDGAAGAARFFSGVGGPVEGPLALLSATLAMIARFRGSTGVERLQLKWLAYGVIVVLVTLAMSALASLAGASIVGHRNVADLPGSMALVVMPVCTGVAILRYRLYEIDRVINRTLVYGALTVCLSLTYLASVLALEQVFSAVGGDSSLAVAGSTLTLAGAFGPLRSRIQRLVDRRFFRRRYDAAVTLRSFEAQLRDEVGLSALSVALCTVVADTIQPAHVSLWLRDGAPPVR